MELLHPEIDIMPGRAGEQPMNAAGLMARPPVGSAVLRLKNKEATQNNTYKISLRCENILWQPTWYTITSLAPEKADNLPPAGHPDERGPQDRWLKVYVSGSGTRDILIRFNLPRQPDSRAGRYACKIDVETQVTGGQSDRRRSHIQTLNATLTVRPYYQWGVELTPEKQTVGRRRRSAAYELLVTNEGNDWLYCDVQLPRPTNTLLEAPTQRIAVPPPEPGESFAAGPDVGERLGTQRKMPVLAVTRQRAFRGAPIAEPLPVAAQRVDAPSVPLAPDNPNYQGVDYVLAHVVPGEIRPVPGNPILEYHPPIPASVPQLFTRIGASLRSLPMLILGLFMLIIPLRLAYEHLWRAVSVNPLEYNPNPKDIVHIKGKWVAGSIISIKGDVGNSPLADSVECTADKRNKFTAEMADVCVFEVPDKWKGFKGTLTARRGILPLLSLLMPSSHPISFRVGGGEAVVAHDEPPSLLTGSLPPGGLLRIRGSGLGDKGVVSLNGDSIKVNSWKDGEITAFVPQTEAAAASLPVGIEPAGKPFKMVGNITITKNAEPGGGTGGGGTGGGGAGGGKGGGGGGGGKKPFVVIKPPKPHVTPPVVTPSRFDSEALANAYNALLVNDWTRALAEIEKAPDAAQNPMALAMKGYARARQSEAEMGDTKQATLTEADSLLSQAETLNKGQQTPGLTLILAAQAYILLQRMPEGADDQTQNDALVQVVGKLQQARKANQESVIQYLIASDCFLQLGEEAIRTKNLELVTKTEEGIAQHLQFIMERDQALTYFKLAQYAERQNNMKEAEKNIKLAEQSEGGQKVPELRKQAFRRESQQIQLNLMGNSP